jgi:2-succinyl-5-enolpyruvyl-6-hydroxy-3-cyclohexene-1-carboxylate synthase
VTGERVCCVIGDLSFFYDQIALWNRCLRGNLRIMLLNNGRGGIFNMLRGLEQSHARDALVAASHDTTAEGICWQNNVLYQRATDMDSLQRGIDWLLQTKSEHPLLLEVLTDARDDERAYKDYYATFR